MSAAPAEPTTGVEHRDETPDGTEPLWARLRVMLERAPDTASLISHGVDVLHAYFLRRAGEPVPEDILVRERTASLVALAAPSVLAKLREVHDGGLLLVKGPEVAARYPGRARGYGDLDLIVDDAEGLQRRLLDVGFIEINDPDLYVDIHHLRPLVWPKLPIKVELHTRPKWVDGLRPPSNDELMEASEPALSGPAGVMAPSAAHHAVLMAVHGWAHVPLRRLRDVVDTAALLESGGRSEATAIARTWGVGRIWDETLRVSDSMLEGRGRSLAVTVWARHLPAVRERTVFESHLEQILSPWSTYAPTKALQQSVTEIAADFSPAENETWPEKGRRAMLALRHAFTARSKHDESLGEAASRRRQ